jgi:transmembrane sensor
VSTQLPYTDAQRREAADWFVLIRDANDAKSESFQAWLRWMDQHEGNHAAFDAIARAWHGVWLHLPLPTDEELRRDDYDGSEPVAEWLAKQGASGALMHTAAWPRSRIRLPPRSWLAAAASLVILIAGLLIMSRYLFSHRTVANEFATRLGEQIEITLADGSHVWLGPQSELRVRFDAHHRKAQLTTGEAFFTVKPDRTRPFTVVSAGGNIVAVGTAFNVRALNEHVTVTVSEGVVAVTPRMQLAKRTPQSVRVTSGQELTFSAHQPVEALTIVESPTPGERARWREGVLVYRDEPLRAVVSDVVRHSGLQIEIADAAIGDLHYTGVIYHETVREWVTALPHSFPVTIVSDGERQIIKAR